MLQLHDLSVAISTCSAATLQTVMKIAEGPLRYIRHGLYLAEIFFFFFHQNILYQCKQSLPGYNYTRSDKELII